MRHFTEDRRKLQELILYISQQCASDENYGSTILNKILFFADFLAYAKFGQPITGTEYIREEHGPVPRPIRDGYNNPVNELIRAGDMRRVEKPLPRNMKLIIPVALRDPDLSVFSEQEIALAKSVIDSFRGWRAGRLSKYTHEFVAWQCVALNETIPYETIFISPDQQLSKREIEFGQEIARRRGWLRERS